MTYLNPVRHVTVDAADPTDSPHFWAEVTVIRVEDSDPGDSEVLIEAGHRRPLGPVFGQVPKASPPEPAHR